MQEEKKNLDKSAQYRKRAENIIPHLTGTFSRAATAFIENVYPLYIESGNGSHFTDVDGNEYLDYLMGLGPITLGYNYDPVNQAIKNNWIKEFYFHYLIKLKLNYLN